MALEMWLDEIADAINEQSLDCVLDDLPLENQADNLGDLRIIKSKCIRKVGSRYSISNPPRTPLWRSAGNVK